MTGGSQSPAGGQNSLKHASALRRVGVGASFAGGASSEDLVRGGHRGSNDRVREVDCG